MKITPGQPPSRFLPRLLNRQSGGAILLALALIVFITQTLWPAAHTVTHSYIAYYFAARLLWEGRWSPQVYDDHWFSAQILALTDGRIGDVNSANLPTMALVLWPLAWLDAPAARFAWSIANGAIFALTLWIMRRLAHRDLGDSGLDLYLIALALVAAPIADNFRVGQAYALLLFLFTLAWWGLETGRADWAGAGLALPFVLRVSGLPLWGLLAVRRNGRALLWAGTFSLAMIVVSLPWLTPEGWATAARTAPDKLTNSPSMAVTAYQTTAGFFQHFLRYDAQWNPGPLVDAPALALILTVLVTAGALALTWIESRGAPLPLAFGATIVVSVILFPLSQEYHFVLMLIPIFALAANLVRGGARPSLLVLCVLAVALIVLPLPYKHPRLSTGTLALLAYPRLYGGWILWGVLLARIRATRNAARESSSGEGQEAKRKP